jgi:ribonuclease R
VEGLVPIETLRDDHYRYHENARIIRGERTRKTFAIGDALRVRLDRADTVERRLQFAVVDADSGRRRKNKR